MGIEGMECDVRNCDVHNDKGPKHDLRGFASSRCSMLPFLLRLFLFLSSILYIKDSLCIP